MCCVSSQTVVYLCKAETPLHLYRAGIPGVPLAHIMGISFGPELTEACVLLITFEFVPQRSLLSTLMRRGGGKEPKKHPEPKSNVNFELYYIYRQYEIVTDCILSCNQQ